jgi:hypothetical protein
MAALMGTVAQLPGEPGLVAVAGLLLVALSAARYAREFTHDPE